MLQFQIKVARGQKSSQLFNIPARNNPKEQHPENKAVWRSWMCLQLQDFGGKCKTGCEMEAKRKAGRLQANQTGVTAGGMWREYVKPQADG